MKHREKEERVWKKISFTTKQFGNRHIMSLGTPKGLEESPVEKVWEFLHNPANKPD